MDSERDAFKQKENISEKLSSATSNQTVSRNNFDRITQYLKIIRSINQLIVREKDKPRLLQKTCDLLTSLDEVARVFILEASPSGTVQEVHSDRVIAPIDHLVNSQFVNWIKRIIISKKSSSLIDTDIRRLLGIKNFQAMAFPLRHKKHTMGIMILSVEQAQNFGQEEKMLLEELASDLAYSLYTFNLEEENASITEAIRFINRQVEGNNSEEILDALVANIAERLSADLVFAGRFLDEDGQKMMRTIAAFKNGMKIENFQLKVDSGFYAHVMKQGICIFEKNADRKIPEYLSQKVPGVQGFVGIPLKGVSSEPIGILVALTKKRIANLHMMSRVFQVFAHRAAVELFRLRSEQKLKESEQRYRDIFENAPFGIYRITPEGEILIANPSLLKLLGYRSLNQFKKETTVKEIYPDSKEREKFLRKVMRSKGFVIFDSRFKKKNGAFVYVRQRARAVRGGSGRVIYIEGFVEDITQSKEQEERIRYQNKLLEFASDAIIGTDGSYRIKFWNKSAERLYGWKAEEVMGRKIDQVVKMDIEYARRLEIRKIAQKTGYWRGEVVQYNRDGNKLFIEMSVSDLRDEKGNVIASVGINRDISEKIRYEKALKASEESYRGLFDSVMEAIYIQAPDGTFLDVNEGAVRMYGYPKEYLIGKNPGDVAAPGRNDMERVLQQFSRALQGEPQQFEFWGKRANGEEFPKNVRLYKGKYFGQDVVIALAEDITEKKKLEEDKKNLERQVHRNQRLETIGTLAGGIAHDFNNILTPILGYAEMIKMSVKDDIRLKNKADQIINASLRARDLIQQILTFSRQIDQQVQPVLLQQLINEATHLLRASIPTTIKLRKEIDKSCPPVMADPAQLHQVLINLCTNAYHAMEKTGGELFIGLKQVHVDDKAARMHAGLKPGLYNQLIVSDTGEGMEPWVMERIFEPFFTTKEVGKGTGLGLSVVHGIVKNYHGDITVYSEKGKGTVFHVYLPVADVGEMEKVQKQENIPHGTENILLVDDEPSVLQLEQQMLEYFGYKTQGLTESKKVMEALIREPQKYKMLITDLTMPGLTGMQLAKMVRTRFPQLPIIMVTGYSEELTDDIKDKYGIQAILMKPVVASELAITVRTVLDNKA